MRVYVTSFPYEGQQETEVNVLCELGSRSVTWFWRVKVDLIFVLPDQAVFPWVS